MDIQAFNTAYPGSMVARKDGQYIDREDGLSLAGALLEAITVRDRKIEDLEDQVVLLKHELTKTRTPLQQLHAALHD